MKVNWNEIARDITKLEGGKVNLPIAQVKEVLRCFRIVLWLKYKDSVLQWMGFLYDLAKRVSGDGEAYRSR